MNNGKKGAADILPTFLVKLVFTIGYIILITLLLVIIWNVFVGNENKTEKDNFETLYKLIESKSKSNEAYDSTKLTVYLDKTNSFTTDHTIMFFSDETKLNCENGKPIYRPSSCGDTKVSCLCLYDSDPDRAEDEKDDDVILCKKFSTLFKIAKEDFHISNYSDDCKRGIKNEYMNLIVGVQNINGKKRVFVWENTPENRKTDEQLKKSRCPEKTGICKDRKDSEIVYELKEVSKECGKKDPDKYYWEAKCVFDGKKCDIECTGESCSKISSCMDFNMDKNYYIPNSKEEFFCNNKVCNKNCAGNLVEQYTCKTGKELECKKLINNELLPSFIENCSIKIGDYSSLISGRKKYDSAKIVELGDILGFDSKKQNSQNYDCKGEIEKYFQKYNVMVCAPGVNCNDFIIKSPPNDIKNIISNCDINPFKASGNIVITKNNGCTEIGRYFIEAHYCSDSKIVNFI